MKLPAYLQAAHRQLVADAEAMLRGMGVDPAAAAAAGGRQMLSTNAADPGLSDLLRDARTHASLVSISVAGAALFTLLQQRRESPAGLLQVLLAARGMLAYAEAMQLQHQVGATSVALAEAADVADRELQSELALRDMEEEAKAIAQRERIRALGQIGAATKHGPAKALREWALEAAPSEREASRKKDDRSVARRLAQRIPRHLVNASADPERFIYDALRAAARRGSASAD